MEGQTLPAKMQGQLRLISQCHDRKQYKRGLKTANGILKKYPNHGETLALKGLLLHDLGKKDEAFEHVKLGVRHNLKSHICWHVYGILYRADRQYDKSLAAYRRALSMDPENIQILRDLAFLQIQSRDVRGYCETQRTLLTGKGTNKMHWLGFAVAHHLLGHHEMAAQTLRLYDGTLDPTREPGVEDGELTLYQARVLSEGRLFEEALQVLDTALERNRIPHRTEARLHRAALLTHLGRTDEARDLYRSLLHANSEDWNVHNGLVHASFGRGLPAYAHRRDPVPSPVPGSDAAFDHVTADRFLELYDEIAATYPRSRVVPRLILDCLPASHPQFGVRLRRYIYRALRRGISSLWHDLKALYPPASPATGVSEFPADHAMAGKPEVLDGIVGELLESLRASPSRLPPIPGHEEGGEGGGEEEEEPPTTLLWALLFAAEHFDRRGQEEDALACIDAALEHTPTCVELYVTKARILSHSGAHAEAADVAYAAHPLDISDRFVGSKAAKYMLRAGRIEAGEDMGVFFSRSDTFGLTPMGNIINLQTLWYEHESALALERAGRLGAALRRFGHTEKHFADFEENQFDFHPYCLRRAALNSYVDFLRWEDSVRSHPFHIGAMTGQVRCFLALHSDPSLRQRELEAAEEKEAEEKEEGGKKQDKKGKKSKEDAAAGAGGGGGEEESKDKEEDKDMDGVQLLRDLDDPLARAHDKAKMLIAHGKGSVEANLAVLDVALVRGKLLQAVRALRRAATASQDGPESPELLVARVRTAHAVQTGLAAEDDESMPESVRGALRRALSEPFFLGPHASPAALVDSWVEAQGSLSLHHRVSAAKALSTLGAELIPRAGALVSEWSSGTITARAAAGALEWAKSVGDEGLVADLLARGRDRFPRADAFKTDG